MKCGATGRLCPYTCNESGEYPCRECEAGKAFVEQMARQPKLTDDD